MHPKVTQIHLLRPLNTYLEKSLAALNPVYLNSDNIPT